MSAHGEYTFAVDPSEQQQRLDGLISARLVQLSRSLAASLIRKGCVSVDGSQRKPAYKVKAGEIVSVCIPQAVPADLKADPIALDILYEDQDLIVVNKAADMVVHPAAGHWSGTLVNALLHHCPDLEGIGGEKRPGIVHRLDKDTSGVLVVAKNDQAHGALSHQFKARLVQKTYLAVVSGSVKAESGCIDLPIGRHPVDRKKMSTFSPRGRSALTYWRVIERVAGATVLEIDLKTGRTHQIRVHCAAIGHPVMGDPVYGRQRSHPPSVSKEPDLLALIQSVGRQMLHAMRLALIHPRSHAPLSFEAAMPEDMAVLLDGLRAKQAHTSLIQG